MTSLVVPHTNTGVVFIQVRALISALVKDVVPSTWKNGLVQADMGAAGWIDDLAKKLVHLESLSKSGAKSGPGAPLYWLGGLFNPDAFVTASRQHVARALSCSLEELRLSLVVGTGGDTNAGKGNDLQIRKPDTSTEMHNNLSCGNFVPD